MTFSSVYIIDWLKKHYERINIDICLVLTLTYVLMDNFLSLFFYISPASNGGWTEFSGSGFISSSRASSSSSSKNFLKVKC